MSKIHIIRLEHLIYNFLFTSLINLCAKLRNKRRLKRNLWLHCGLNHLRVAHKKHICLCFIDRLWVVKVTVDLMAWSKCFFFLVTRYTSRNIANTQREQKKQKFLPLWCKICWYRVSVKQNIPFLYRANENKLNLCSIIFILLFKSSKAYTTHAVHSRCKK